MKNSKWLIVIFGVIIAAVIGGKYLGIMNSKKSEPSAPVETKPYEGSEVPIPTGNTYYSNADANVIVITSPTAGSPTPSTFVVRGKARGTWYFEASFPLEVVDGDGKTLVQMPVQALGDWMTQDFVPFAATVTVPTYSGPAQLILKNDNPSGLPENEKSITIPITLF